MAIPTDPEFQRLHQQVCVLHQRSKLLKDVFSDPKTVDTLNQCAPNAFCVIKDAFVDLVILGIARIVTDRGGKKLTLGKLIHRQKGTAVEQRLEAILKKAVQVAKPLKDHRDNRIAHCNSDVAGGSEVLSSITVNEIETALELIRDFMNEFSRANGGGAIGYENIIANGDGKSLVHIVNDGMQLRNLRRLSASGSSPEQIIAEVWKR